MKRRTKLLFIRLLFFMKWREGGRRTGAERSIALGGETGKANELKNAFKNQLHSKYDTSQP